ncbi:hypothetical protein [Paenibacillus xylanilyticus]|uniref:hypothetical protein n=1 Tax=Paenibacillus xylanilyticus TaxID=248903 RepID=UPI0039A16AA2
MKLKYSVALLVLIVLLTGCTSETFKLNISEGDEKFSNEQYGEAFKAYEKALNEEPNNEDAKSKVDQAKSKYVESVKSINLEIISSSAVAEQLIGTYSKLWLQAIQDGVHLEEFAEALNVSNATINPIIGEVHYSELLEDNDFSKVNDFSVAVAVAEKYYEKQGDLETLEKARSEVSNTIKKLALPPQDYQAIYDETFDLYNNYEKYIDLAIQPSGSLSSYSNNAQALVSDIISGTKSVDAKLPQ